MRKIVVLRGVPGTGKSTFALKYYKDRKNKYPNEVVTLVSRDGYRMLECKFSEAEYQKSFVDDSWNGRIIRDFWKYVSDTFNKCDVMILDTTMCKYQDIYTLYWHLFEYMARTNIMVKIRWKVCVTEHGSTHSVPVVMMHEYWDNFNDTMSYVECGNYLVVHDNDVVPADEKIVYVS